MKHQQQKQVTADATRTSNSKNKRPDESINCDADTGRGAKLRPDLIGAIDQGTSSTRFLVFENLTGRLVASSQIEIKRITPKEGWVEIEPNSIMSSVFATMANVHEQLKGVEGHHMSPLKCMGICNQRESTVVWDSQTGQPLYNAIVWMDNRTKDLVDNMIDSVPGRDLNRLKDKTGLPMSTYFSAFKLKWLIENVAQVRQALDRKRLLFGTVDTWILWNLTGKHLTDVTNASRTFLMDIETLSWDKSLCKQLKVPVEILPKIQSSADNFGQLQFGPFMGTPITGVIGDQSAALFGHNCLQLGKTKATFGTGCFIMQNIGPGPLNGALSGVNREAKRGLITTVAYKLGDRPACYALEGSIKIAGAALTWLRDNLQLIANYEECDHLVNQTTNSAGVFFVPALGGLYSPYWDPNAAGLYIGLSQFTKREHLARATFDSIAFQTNDILSLMRGVANGLMIDGGLCKSDNLCQILADITGYDIVRPAMCETSALGAAMVAACGAGIWPFESMMASSAANANICSPNTTTNHHYPHESLNYEEKFSALIQSKSLKSSQRAAEQHQQQLIQRQQTSSGRQRRASRHLRSANLGAHLVQCNLDSGGGVNDDAGGGGTSCPAQETTTHFHIKAIPLAMNSLSQQQPSSATTSTDNELRSDVADDYDAEIDDLEEDSTSASRPNSSDLARFHNLPEPQQADAQPDVEGTTRHQDKQPDLVQQHEHLLESSYESSQPDANQHALIAHDETLKRFYAPTSSGYSSGDNFELATTISATSCQTLDPLAMRQIDSPSPGQLLASSEPDAASTTTAMDAATPSASLSGASSTPTTATKTALEPPARDAPISEPSPGALTTTDQSTKHQQEQMQLRKLIKSNQLACDQANSEEVLAFGGRDSYGEDGYDSSTASNFDTEDDYDDDDDDDNEPHQISMIERQDDSNNDNSMSNANHNNHTNIGPKDRDRPHKRASGSGSQMVEKKQVDIFQPYISLEHRTDLVNTWRLAVERSMQWTKVHHEEIRRIDYQRLSSLPISMYLFFSIGLVALSSILSGAHSPLSG